MIIQQGFFQSGWGWDRLSLTQALAHLAHHIGSFLWVSLFAGLSTYHYQNESELKYSMRRQQFGYVFVGGGNWV